MIEGDPFNGDGKVFPYLPDTFSEISHDDSEMRELIRQAYDGIRRRATATASIHRVLPLLKPRVRGEISSEINAGIDNLNDEFVDLLKAGQMAGFTTSASQRAASYAQRHKDTGYGSGTTDIDISTIADPSRRTVDPLNRVFLADARTKDNEAEEEIDLDERFRRQKPLYVQFRRAIASACDPDAPQISEQEALSYLDGSARVIGPTACPITGLDYEDPVRTKCNHHFSRAGIMDYLKDTGNTGARCPIAGCSYTITSRDLISDPDFLDTVRHWKQLQEQERQAHTQHIQRV